MKIERVWAMPSKHTFAIKPIKELLGRYVGTGVNWVDPFAGYYSPAEITNDLNFDCPTYFHMDALEFLKTIPFKEYHEGVLFDPPYSEEQCLRKYKPIQMGTAGRAEYWAKCKDEIAKIIHLPGWAISFGWDSCGMGKGRGFEIIEILLICHGACHNDTIVTVEKKIATT